MVGASARAAGLGAAATVAVGWLAWWLAAGVLDRWSGALTTVAVEESFALLVSGAAAVLAAWAACLLARATLTLVGEAVRGRDAVARGGLTGRVAAGLLVAATLGGVQTGVASAAPAPVAAAPVAAAPVAAAQAGQPPSASFLVTDGPGTGDDLPVPGWTPTTAPAPRSTTGTVGEVGLVSTAPATARPVADDVVVVRSGDTLWDIAARALGEHATDQDVAEAWPRWYAANQSTIGDDPDHILPGQQLVAPAEEGAR